jgi:hypothetical protein
LRRSGLPQIAEEVVRMSWLRRLFQANPTETREYAIFVSYSRRDFQIVKPLVEMLRLSGAGVFQDVDQIPPGTRWRAVLTDALDSCQVCVLFWCHHSAESVYVRSDCDRAAQGGKLLTPILLDNTPLDETLPEYQAIDMRGLF